MATKTHGKATSVVHGGYDISQWLNSITPTETVDVVDSSMFQQNDKTYVAGRSDAKLTCAGRFEGAITGVNHIIESYLMAQVGPVTAIGFGMGGPAAGQTAMFGRVKHTSYATTAPVDGLVTLSNEQQFDNGFHHGIHLLPEAAVVATTTGASQTFALPSGVPWAASIHVLANTVTSTGITVDVQTSANGTTWVGSGQAQTFAAATGPTSVLLTGTTVAGSYVRAVITFNGTGSATVLATFGIY